MASSSQSDGVSKNLLILQIEDNRADAELAMLELSKAGFEVSADVVDTLADVASRMAAKFYDVVLADYRLRGWAGTDALPIVRQQQANIPFILVTGALGEDTAVECVKNGVTDFVLKDHLARLPSAIRRALREKSLGEERNRALRELAESEARFRNLVDASPDAIFVSLEGKVSFANPATLTLLGARTPEEIKGRSISELVHPDDLTKIKELISTVFERGEASAPVEHTLIRMDGSPVVVEGIAIPIRWQGSLALEVVIRDITERKRAEQTVLEWQKRLEMAAKAALPIGFWEWDLTTDTRVWSGEVYRQLGYPRDNFSGKGKEFLYRVHPEDRPQVEAAVQAVVSGLSRTYEVQVRAIRPDGTTCWIDSRGVVVHEGAPRVIGIAIDVTKLRRSEASYRSIVERAPYGIYRASSAGRFLMANPALVKMLGYDSESEVLSLDIAHDVYCNFEDRAQLVSRVIEAGEVKDAEYEWKRKDGCTITIRISVILVRKDSGDLGVFQGVVQDITERKILARQFRQAQKMEAVGRLAGGVAHDFNNLLMIFGSYAELIKQRKVDDDKVNRYADQLSKAATRGAAITRQLLAFSRQQVLEPQVLDLNNVVVELGKVLPRLLGEDVAVVTTLEPMLHPVKLDPGQLEQIIMNLAINARDAMPKGGRFEIKTRNVEANASYVAEHRPMDPGAYVRLTVIDTGMGMDAETQARIFEPFFTTKERGKGTGLGLAMVYGTVKQSGGFIWISSGVGQGTRFDIFFPPVREAITRDSTLPAETAASGGSETILLVEDEEALRVSTCEFLRSKGYTVLMAGDGAEAMRICQLHTGNIDLILTDIVMPGMDGVEVAKAVRARYPEIRVLYMSGYINRSVEGLGAGAVLLQKPFSLAVLASKVRASFATASRREVQR
jgi:two-component system cell cycle sensor histidine kinase/response regulator CckA